jgi:hypothetical protein
MITVPSDPSDSFPTLRKQLETLASLYPPSPVELSTSGFFRILLWLQSLFASNRPCGPSATEQLGCPCQYLSGPHSVVANRARAILSQETFVSTKK